MPALARIGLAVLPPRLRARLLAGDEDAAVTVGELAELLGLPAGSHWGNV